VQTTEGADNHLFFNESVKCPLSTTCDIENSRDDDDFSIVATGFEMFVQMENTCPELLLLVGSETQTPVVRLL